MAKKPNMMWIIGIVLLIIGIVIGSQFFPRTVIVNTLGMECDFQSKIAKNSVLTNRDLNTIITVSTSETFVNFNTCKQNVNNIYDVCFIQSYRENTGEVSCTCWDSQ